MSANAFRHRPVLAVSAGLVVLTAGAFATRGLLQPLTPPRLHLPVWILAGLFFATQSTAVHIQLRREARSVFITEVPLLLGLLYASPGQLLAARLIGGLGAQIIVRRQYRQPAKLAFNATICVVEAVVAMTVFQALLNGAPRATPHGWIAAVVGATVVNVLAAVAIATVIGRLEKRAVAEEVLSAAAGAVPQAVATSVLGLVAASALLGSSAAWVPLSLTFVSLLFSYRAYSALHDRHRGLQRMYTFAQAATGAFSETDAVRSILAHARELLQAEQASLTTLQPGAMVAETITFTGSDYGPSVRLDLAADGNLWLYDRVVRGGTAALASRDTRDADAAAWLRSRGLREAVCVPLQEDGSVVAILEVHDRLGEARGFDESDVRLMETVAVLIQSSLRTSKLLDQLRHESLHDALTGLPNRSSLVSKVQAELAANRSIAVAVLGLNSFKEVNDTLGHECGDQLLREVGRRLDSAVGQGANLARLGGDEFGILLLDCMDRNQATRFGRAIHAALQDPVKLGGIDVDVSGSLGLAFADGYTTDAAKLLRQADMAMYAAKERGRPSMLFDPSHEVSTPARLARLTRLRQAISAGELEVHFQPKLRLSDGAVCGVEALARWCDSDLGWVSPDEFIPLAERAGLIRPLTDLVLRQSLAACSRWQSVAPGIGVAVNISARSMFDRGIAEQIARLREFSPAVGLLTLEITESSVMTDPGSTVELLRQLHTLGVRLAIDDFGTGYSSLSYLQRLPVDEIKVDKAFVQGVDENAEDAAIVRAVVELGHALGLTVVAEGVERPETLDQLRNLGCDQIQGYLISRPVPEASLVDWLHRRLPRLRVAQGA